MTNNENIQLLEKVKSLPNKPGVYQYFDEKGKIIYVGKAKSLKNRVNSYFALKKHHSAKTAVLVKKIVDLKYILVDTEIEALIIENSLIKQHQPKYNIQLKDDKTFPWIVIKNERFPRVMKTRVIEKDGSAYFGPYTNPKFLYEILSLLKQLYKIRNCNYALTKGNIEKKKFKLCLEYHIGNCLAPCENKQTETDYNLSIEAIKNIIKGDFNVVIKSLVEEMNLKVKELAFEHAQEIKQKIDILEKYKSKSVVFNPTYKDVDVFSIINDEKYAYVNFLKIMNGAIVQGQTIELKKKLDETAEDILILAIVELRQRFNSEAKEVLVPFQLPDLFEGVSFKVPQIGDKKVLLELSLRNAKTYQLQRLKQEEIKNPHQKTERILLQLQKDLRLQELPIHIECFDNSNIQGSYPVAACVVFKNGKPSKKDYRHFNIKTVEGPNDFASMEEIIYRRYSRLLEEKKTLPQLIIVDGGKGQLSAALKSLEKLQLRGKIGIVGIAKRLEEIYFPNDSIPAYIDKRSESLKLIQFLRNEAHRFGITHHRNSRSKGAIQSVLNEIEGIGEKTVFTLLKAFKSVENIKNSNEEDLVKVVGKSKAKVIFQFFHQKA
jgi:excinuclease ABC subunit C